MPDVTATTDPGAGRVRSAIASAAARSGIAFDYLYNQARVESGLDPAAKARTSSAAGLFQFTRQTWLQTLERHGAAHGLGWAADAIGAGPRGLTVADPELRTAIDQLRFDPEVASAMAAELAVDNRAQLEDGLGRAAEPVDLYLAHFLGAGGAKSFLAAHRSDPDAAAAPLFPAAAVANRPIFYRADGSARSLDEIRTSFAARLGAPAPAGDPFPAPRFVATRRDIAESGGRPPLALASIEAMPQRLSLEFAARAYRRLEGLGA